MIIAARPDHLNDMMAIDPVAAFDPNRFEDVEDSVEKGQAYVAVLCEKIVGYITLSDHFFSHCFIELVITDPAHRRSGVAPKLADYIKTICKSQKLFTLTNKSNIPAQNLFLRQGFVASGELTGLDDDDPELFFLFERDKK